MSAHTEGPWMVGEEYEILDRVGQRVVATAYHNRPQADANAQLIAAAPELLMALKELVEALDERDIRMMSLTRCRQAIAAAERRQGA